MDLQEITFALLLLVVATYVVYSLIPSARDAHPLVVLQQSNLGSVRQEGESGVYRSHFCPHGLPLLKGLQIQGENYRLRNGNMADLLELAENITDSTVHKTGAFLLKNNKPRVTILWDKNRPEYVDLLFACALYGCTVVIIGPSYSGDGLRAAVREAGAHNIVATHNEHGVILDQTSWDTIKNTFTAPPAAPPLDETHAFLGFVHSDLQRRVSVTYYNHSHVVAALVGQLKGFPQTHEINQRDKVFFADSIGEPFPLVLYLATLAIGAHTTETLSDATVVVTTQVRMQALLQTKLSVWQKLLLSRAQSSLANGQLNRTGVLAEYKNTRMVFFAAQEPALASTELGTLRALTGAHLVYSLMSRDCLSPIVQTNIYDYRRINGVVFGPVPPCVEAKVLSESEDKVTRGKLYIQSPAASQKGWIETEYKGEWGSDGAFRLK